MDIFFNWRVMFGYLDNWEVNQSDNPDVKIGSFSHFNKNSSPKIVAPPHQTSRCVLSRVLLACGSM
jgi:hypothetical protein